MWPRPSFFPECVGIGVGSGSNISVVVSGSFGGTDFSKWDVSVGILCSALWFLVSTLPEFEPGIAGLPQAHMRVEADQRPIHWATGSCYNARS